MKFEDDFALVSQQATCRIDNVWEKPAKWKNCVESKIWVEKGELLSSRLMIIKESDFQLLGDSGSEFGSFEMI